MTREVEVQRVIRLVRDWGTIVTFVGLDINNNATVEFAVDRRTAQPLADALNDPGEMPPLVEIEEWQVIRVSAR